MALGAQIGVIFHHLFDTRTPKFQLQYIPDNLTLAFWHISDNSHNRYLHNCMLPHWLWCVDNSHILLNSHKMFACFLCKLSGLHCIRVLNSHCYCINNGHRTFFCHLDTAVNKNAFQSKAHLPLANRKSNTYNLTLKWPWPSLWPWPQTSQTKLNWCPGNKISIFYEMTLTLTQRTSFRVHVSEDRQLRVSTSHLPQGPRLSLGF